MKTQLINLLYFILASLLFAGCTGAITDFQKVNEYPSIYPDYVNVTIPYNISPLNFMLKKKCEKVEALISSQKRQLTLRSDYKIQIPVKEWKKLLGEQKGDSVVVTITAKYDGKWIRFKPFAWYVAKEPIDPYLTYRLIEPSYEVWNKLSICQRNLETFDENVIVDNSKADGACINCHIVCNQDPKTSFFHLRGKNGGTFINKDGKIRKLYTKTDQTLSSLIYGNWHPSAKFIAFSTNILVPAYHSMDRRLEVYDKKSDVVVLDVDKNEVFTSNLLSSAAAYETFPTFSADGRKLYFCTAPAVAMPENYKTIRYSLCSIDFNADTHSFGNHVDTLVSATATGKTASEPRVSPDGKYLLYASFDYGNFPIWHREADLYLFNLSTRQIDTLPNVNADYADSYHSWSSNSRWFVFASKRDNGMYGKPYFAYIDENGKTYKPFVLPQEDPEFYDYCLVSFNIPELSKGPVPFDSYDVGQIYNKGHAEKVRFVGDRP
jgi:hypothetical protein